MNKKNKKKKEKVVVNPYFYLYKKKVNPYFQVHSLPLTSIENTHLNQTIGQRMAHRLMSWIGYINAKELERLENTRGLYSLSFSYGQDVVFKYC